MIDVVVGKSKSRWHLHAKLLTENSDFFKKIINSSFKEGKEKLIKLPDDNEAEFILFVQWLYSGDFTSSSLSRLCRVYAMADKFAALEFRDAALDKAWALNLGRCKFRPNHLIWIHENTMPESGLHKLAFDTVGLGIISKEVNFTAAELETLEPMMTEILQSVVRVSGLQAIPSFTRLSRFDYSR